MEAKIIRVLQSLGPKIKRRIARWLNKKGIDNQYGRPDFMMAEEIMEEELSWWEENEASNPLLNRKPSINELLDGKESDF